MVNPPPLRGIRVLEFGGLAPGPFAGMLLADYGASVLRIDRAMPGAHTPDTPPPTADQLVRRKTSIAVDIKTAAGAALVKALLPHVDVLLDPFRPGVLEKAGLSPSAVLLAANPRLVVARLTGFRRDGKYAAMAGHDINYLAVSGVLGMLGRAGAAPHPPGNLLGDFAGGGAVCFAGILLALLARQATGRGQVVEANMVDGSAYLATMPRMSTKRWTWSGARGTNLLDGGSPFYDTYETADGKYMAVGALEPRFFSALLAGLSLKESDLPGPREDRESWPALRQLFTKTFLSKTRREWEEIFDGTDACCTPILTHQELEEGKVKQRPFVTLRSSPSLAISANEGDIDEGIHGQGPGVEYEGWSSGGLSPGVGGEETLKEWLGWKRGQQFDVVDGGLVLKTSAKL